LIFQLQSLLESIHEIFSSCSRGDAVRNSCWSWSFVVEQSRQGALSSRVVFFVCFPIIEGAVRGENRYRQIRLSPRYLRADGREQGPGNLAAGVYQWPWKFDFGSQVRRHAAAFELTQSTRTYHHIFVVSTQPCEFSIF
jgi:hypothetical protein